MKFRIGQKVICVAEPKALLRPPWVAFPRQGNVYTIRGYRIDPIPSVLLYEIQSLVGWGWTGGRILGRSFPSRSDEGKRRLLLQGAAQPDGNRGMNKAVIAMVVMVLCLPLTSSVALTEVGHWLPDPSRTPGVINPAVTQDNIGRTICVSGWTKTIRPPVSYTNRLKKKQMAQYGYGNINPRLLEEDHRLPLELGGNPTDPRNLWPELWKGTFGAHAKDRLENLIHRQVCLGKMTLKDGRAIFFGNWITAYKRYVLHQPQVARAR